MEIAYLTEHQIEILLKAFHSDVEAVVASDIAQLYSAIKGLNPLFEPEEYSQDKKSNAIANIVAGIYSPLIHSYSYNILMNIKHGNLPNKLFIPPRDSIPIYYSIMALNQDFKLDLDILTPAINRKISGIANNQSDYTPQEDPLLDEYIFQHFAHYHGQPIAELETGIYGTTTLALANKIKSLGLDVPILPVKWYGLGPNVSFAHQLVSKGEVSIDQYADPKYSSDIAKTMIILDSMEELGLQNIYDSPEYLVNDNGYIHPKIVFTQGQTFETSQASNLAIVNTAGLYGNTTGVSISQELLANLDTVAAFSTAGIPLSLKQPIPPMDNKAEHFDSLQQAIDQGIIVLPNIKFYS